MRAGFLSLWHKCVLTDRFYDWFCCQNGKLITAVSNNTVQIHTFPEGAPDGILTRFPLHVNHVTFSPDGTKVAAGAR